MNDGKIDLGRPGGGGAKRRAAGLRLVAIAAAAAVAAACASPEERVEKYYQSGVEYLEKDDLPRANIQFRNALKINEEHVPTLVAMSELAEKRQDLQMMYAFLQRIVRLDPDHIESQIKFGRLELIASDEVSALERAEKALALDPDNIDATTLKAAVRLRVGDSAGAVEIARGVIAVDPGNLEATTILATERALAGDFEAAIGELDRALKVDPELAILQVLRIRLLTYLGRTEEVLAGFKTLVDSNPEEVVYRRAYAAELVKQDMLEASLGQIEALVDLEPANIEPKLDVIRLVRHLRGAAAAEEKLRGYVDAEPNNMDLHFALADFLIGERSLDAAKDLLHTRERSSDSEVAARAKNKLATIFWGEGDREQAEALTDEVLAADETNTDGLVMRARIRMEDEEYNEALADLRTALSNDPEAHAVMLLTAVVFERQGNFDVARAEYAKAFEASGEEPGVSNVYASFLVRRNDIARAVETLEQSLAQYPSNLPNLRLLAGLRIQQQDWRGAEEIGSIIDSLSEDGEDDLGLTIRSLALSGLQQYDQVIDLLTENNETRTLATRPLAMLVAAYVNADRLDEAKSLLTGILASDPANYDAHILLTRVLGRLGETEAAEATLNAAIDVDPARPEAFELLYRYFMRTGQQPKAADLLESGLAKAPDNTALKFFKADMLVTIGAREEALALYSDLLEKRPNDKIVANNFVSLSMELQPDEATTARALEVVQVIEDEDNPNFQDTVGWVYYHAGQTQRALEYLTRAAAGASDNAEILYHLGAAQIAAGEREAGRETLERALSAGGEGFRFEPAIRELLEQG